MQIENYIPPKPKVEIVDVAHFGANAVRILYSDETFDLVVKRPDESKPAVNPNADIVPAFPGGRWLR